MYVINVLFTAFYTVSLQYRNVKEFGMSTWIIRRLAVAEPKDIMQSALTLANRWMSSVVSDTGEISG